MEHPSFSSFSSLPSVQKIFTGGNGVQGKRNTFNASYKLALPAMTPRSYPVIYWLPGCVDGFRKNHLTVRKTPNMAIAIPQGIAWWNTNSDSKVSDQV